MTHYGIISYLADDMKKGALLLIAVLVAGCGQQRQHAIKGPDYDKEFLTLVTYNVGNFTKYEDDSSPEAVAFLKRVKADAVTLNELDSCNNRHNEYQLKKVADAMGWENYYFAKALDYAGGSYGNGIMSGETIIRSDIISLPKLDGSETRSVAVVETKRFVLACTHLDHRSKDAQKEQAGIINTWFSEHYKGSFKPVLLCGDMNALPDSETIKTLEECWTRISPTDPTHSTKNPSKCIDYIFFLTATKNVTVRKTEVIYGDDMAQISDHFPVLADIYWHRN